MPPSNVRIPSSRPATQDDVPTPRAHSRPALSIPAQVLVERGDRIGQRLFDREIAVRKAGDHAGANSVRCVREHLAHIARVIAFDQGDDDERTATRTLFFAACDYAETLLKITEPAASR